MPADVLAAALLGRAVDALRLGWSAAPRMSALGLALTVVDGLAPVGAAWCTKLLLDELARGSHGSPARVAAAAAGIAGASVLLGLHRGVADYAGGVAARAMRLAVQQRLFRRVNAFVGLAPFEDPRFLDRLRLAEEAGERAPEEVFVGAVFLLRAVLQAGGFVVALLIVWPAIVLVLVVSAAPTALLHLSVARRRARLHESLSPLLRRQSAYRALLTDARAAKEIRVFGIGGFLQGRMCRDLAATNDLETALARRVVRAELGVDLIAAAVAVLAIAVAAHQALRGRLSVGEVSMFLVAVAGVHHAAGSITGSIGSAYEALLLFGHYREIVAGEPEAGNGVPAAPLGRGVELRDVWFRYGTDQPWVLRGVTFTIPFGTRVGLVGLNGAGKSTIVKLLCRMYEPQLGWIRWDGVDIGRLDPVSLRTRLSTVFQDFMAYDLTAAENVGLGRLSAMDDIPAIRAAAERAGVDATLASLPAGYRTLLSRTFEPDTKDDRAAMLSGGQWQRVALARALLRDDADLLILDEPSAGLDAEAEYAIHRRLRELSDTRTSLLISHRLAALRDADLLVVLDNGRVAEEGTHAELVATGGPYARLFALQAHGYRDDAVAPTT